MRTALEIVNFIDEYVFHCLKRPAMYASTPQALEDVLDLCDFIRNYIMEVEEVSVGDGCTSFRSFLLSKGYGVGLFSTAKENEGLSNSQVFIKLARKFEEYLKMKGF